MSALEKIEHLPRAESAGNGVGDPGGECGVESIHVDGDVDQGVFGNVGEHRKLRGELTCLVDDEAIGVAFEKRTLHRIHRPDAELGETGDVIHLQDASAGTRVGKPIAIEIRVEIGMRVDLNDVDRLF